MGYDNLAHSILLDIAHALAVHCSYFGERPSMYFPKYKSKDFDAFRKFKDLVEK